MLAGLFTLAATVLLGDCAAFGGRCPSPDGLEGDVVGGLAFGAALMVGGPLLAARPDGPGLGRALAVAAAAAVAAVTLLGPGLLT